MSAVGDLIELEIDAVDEQGSGHASFESRTVETPGVFPGERATVRIEAFARHSPRVHGRLRELLSPHAARRSPPCDRHQEHIRELGDRRPKPTCGGCSHMALELEAQREAKRAWILRAYGLELDAPIVGAQALGYRWSSKRVAYARGERLQLGSRAAGRLRGDHIADMRGCLVDHPKLREGFDGLEDQANALAIQAWAGGEGDLRYVWAKTNATQLLVTLITGSEDSKAARELGPRLLELGLADGVTHSVQAGAGNAIRGELTRHLGGLERIQIKLETLGLEPLDVGPLGFLQPNPEVAALAYAELVSGLEPTKADPSPLAFDLYAGAGVTTRLLRRSFAEVVACESYPESAARLGVDAQRVDELLAAWLDAGRPRPQCVVANPPRAGLGTKVCAQLRQLAAPELRIMSCSAKTLAADLERLRGHYTLTSLRAYDTLPQTGHLELVAKLSLAVGA